MRPADLAARPLEQRIAAFQRSRLRGSMRRLQQMTPGSRSSRYRKRSDRPCNLRNRGADGRFLPTPRKEAAS